MQVWCQFVHRTPENMKRRISQLRSLSWAEWCFLLQAIFFLPGTAIALRLFGYQRTLKLFSRSWINADCYVFTKHDRDTVQIATRMIEVAANHGLYRAQCLQKSLVLMGFLHARQIPCNIVLGTRLEGSEFFAHAWVECRGQVINDDAGFIVHFAPIYKQPENSL